MRGMKIRAATQGRKLKDVVADAIRDSLASTHAPSVESAQPLTISRNPSGFPYIKCKPAAEKPAPTIEELQRLIDESQFEEDLQRAGISP